MKSYSTYLAEAKNTHMEHIEDMMFNEGKSGALKAMKFLRDLRDYLESGSTKAVNSTVKWDGAPAIIAGIDPEAGKFFVGAKGVFAKTPKTIKSHDDITKHGYSGGLAEKLKTAFDNLKGIITDGVYQGDIMFSKGDVNTEKIDGESYYTFHPNTIVYAVPTNSPLGAKINSSNIGIVWHTTYTGDSLANMSASFGKDIATKMKDSPSVWTADAMYHDASGTATFTAKETKELDAILKKAEGSLSKIKGNILETIAADTQVRNLVKSYNNSYVRKGTPFPKVRSHVAGLYRHIKQWFEKEEGKRKSPAGKKKVKDKKTDAIQKVFSDVKNLLPVFETFNYLTQAKMLVVAKMNKAASMKTFVKTSKGFKITNPEGYVAIGNDDAVKIVDRWEFSFNNFSPTILKGWEK